MAKVKKPRSARSGGRRKKTDGSIDRAELLQACVKLRATMDARRALLCSIPRRGYSPDPKTPRMPLVYTIPSCGSAEVLRLLTEGKLEVVTPTLVDALIAELGA